MGPIISQLGAAAAQALTQLANSAGAKYMVCKAVRELTKKIKS